MAVYEKLIRVAKERSLISYKELGKVADLDIDHLADLDKLTKILEEIALHELAAQRPLLVALVIRKDLGMPARGLFKFAKAHGIQKGMDDLSFFTKETRRVYDAWETKK